MTAARLTPAAEAHQVIADALGFRPPLAAALADLPAVRIAAVLCDLEQAFQIELEADDALRAGTVGALIDLVGRRVAALAHRAPAPHGVEVYDFTAIRAAIGRPVRPGLLARSAARQPTAHPSAVPQSVEEINAALGARPLTPAERADGMNLPSSSGSSFALDVAAFSVIGAPEYLAPDLVRNAQAEAAAEADPRRRPAGPSVPRRGAVFLLQIFALGFALKALRATIAAALGWPL